MSLTSHITMLHVIHELTDNNAKCTEYMVKQHLSFKFKEQTSNETDNKNINIISLRIILWIMSVYAYLLERIKHINQDSTVYIYIKQPNLLLGMCYDIQYGITNVHTMVWEYIQQLNQCSYTIPPMI